MDFDALFIQINQTMHRSIQKYKEKIIGSGKYAHITLSQLYYLEAIYSLDRPTLSDLAKYLKVSNASVSIGIHKLMIKGLVRRIQSKDDKRSFHLHLSTEGEQLMEAEKQAFSGFSAKIKSALTEKEIETLGAIFKKIMDAYQKEEAMTDEER